MIPKFSSPTYSITDYFIIDECDSIMLDEAKNFTSIYKSLDKQVGGLFFLTATKFEQTTTGKSNEESFIRMLPNLYIVNCKQDQIVKDVDHTQFTFTTLDNCAAKIK